MLRVAMGGPAFDSVRAEALEDVGGAVLEIGFGPGLNYPFYGAGVRHLTALDPVAENRKLFAKAHAAGPIPVTFVEGLAESLPFPDQSFDTVVTTWTLCSVGDPAAALREIDRVLKSSGRYVFVEHGLSIEPRIARWQDRLTPLQRVIGGGCHLNRPIDRLVEASPLTIETLRASYMPGPKIATYLYRGVALPQSRSGVIADELH